MTSLPTPPTDFSLRVTEIHNTTEATTLSLTSEFGELYFGFYMKHEGHRGDGQKPNERCELRGENIGKKTQISETEIRLNESNRDIQSQNSFRK